MWTAWNEPNGRTFAVPVSPRLYVQRVLDPAYASLHRASGANRVAGGVTSPRQTPTGMAPEAFMQGMAAAHAHLDAYAQNPYPESRGESPAHTLCPTCGAFTMAVLPTIRACVTRYFGASKQLWLTEYGYQTNPPDRSLGGTMLTGPGGTFQRSFALARGTRVRLWSPQTGDAGAPLTVS